MPFPNRTPELLFGVPGLLEVFVFIVRLEPPTVLALLLVESGFPFRFQMLNVSASSRSTSTCFSGTLASFEYTGINGCRLSVQFVEEKEGCKSLSAVRLCEVKHEKDPVKEAYRSRCRA